MTEKEVKKPITVGVKALAGISTIIAIISAVATLLLGGTAHIPITASNGAEYDLSISEPTGALKLIDLCGNMKVVGDQCPIKPEVIVTMTKAPDTVVDTIAPEKVDIPTAIKEVVDPVSSKKVVTPLTPNKKKEPITDPIAEKKKVGNPKVILPKKTSLKK